MAVIADRPDIVRFLIGQGADLNSPMCGRPLHLAAKLGHHRVLETLLMYGADPDVMACVCYPDPHHGDAKLVYNWTTRGWGICCPGDVYSDTLPPEITFDYPMFYAINSDDVESMKLLMLHAGDQLKNSASPLNIACRAGAYKCASHFTELSSSTCSLADYSHRVPLQCCLNQNRKFIELLLQSGAELMRKTPCGETLLHLLFKERESFLGMSEMCTYLLDCGLQMNINALDEHGDSALNVCLQRLNQLSHTQLPPPGTEADLEELVTCVRFLLEKKANPNIANKAGDTSLHLLAQTSSLDCDRLLPHKIQLTRTLLELLLAHKANPNLINNSEKKVLDLFLIHIPRVLFGLIQTPGHFDFASLQEGTTEFVSCLTLLHENGCCFSAIHYTKSECLIEGVLHYLHSIPGLTLRGGLGHFDLTTSFRIQQLVHLVRSITECLLQCGCSLTNCACREKHLYYAFKYLFVPDVPSFVLCDFLRLLLTRGAVINVHGPPVSFGGVVACDTSRVPLVAVLRTPTSLENSSQPTEHIVSNATKEHLIKLFCDCMDKSQRDSCFRLFHRNPYKMDSVAENAYLENFVRPVQLKTQCARVIYKALHGKLFNVDALPLPVLIKTYICDLDY